MKEFFEINKNVPNIVLINICDSPRIIKHHFIYLLYTSINVHKRILEINKYQEYVN